MTTVTKVLSPEQWRNISAAGTPIKMPGERRKRPERELARECSKVLELDGFRTLYLEPMARKDLGRGFGERGMADAVYFRYGGVVPYQADVVWVEYKAPHGKVSKAQKLWHDVERKRGALTAIAKVDFPPTVEGFLKWYRETGLMRRKLL